MHFNASRRKWTTLFPMIYLVFAAASGGSFHLSIAHTNDVHARLMPVDQFDQTCNDGQLGQGKCFGGLPRRLAKINELRELRKNLLLLDAGDQFQGTLFYNRYKGDEARMSMNRLGYTAMSLGNHEFDNGPANLARFIRGVQFPVLAANVDASLDPDLAGLLKPYAIAEIGGERVGIVGYITEETAFMSSPGPLVRFLPVEPSIKRAVAALQNQGINKIIAISHAGVGRDKQIAAQVDGIDVIIAGHTHTLLSNEDPATEGPSPIVVSSPGGHPVLIVSAYAYGKYLGYIDVDFDERGIPIVWNSEPILLDETIPEDLATKAWVLDMRAPLDQLRLEVVGRVPNDLDGSALHCRHVECSMGNAVTDAVLFLAKAYGAQAAIMNAGGIRASISQGEVTRWQVIDAFPFYNPITITDMTGATLWKVFEHSVSRAEDHNNDGTGRFLQVSGIRLAWDPQRPVGARVVSLEMQMPDGNYEPVHRADSYRIAANRFISTGGDGYEMLASMGSNLQVLSETPQDALIHYLAERGEQSIGGLERRVVQGSNK